MGTISKTGAAPLSAVTSAVLLTLISATSHAEDKSFNIAAQPLGQALNEFSKQSGIVVMTSSPLVGGKNAPVVAGTMDPKKALDRLLAGSGLKYSTDKSGAVFISEAKNLPPVKPLAMAADVSQAEPAERTGQLEEVVVTAQKREEKLQDVPISISAFTSADLEKQGISSFSQAVAATPSIASTPAYGTPGTLFFFMRGLGTVDPGSVASETAIGTYVDGFYIASSNAQSFDMADIERVEVLRGPQGTLYGFNTAGGAVNLITRKPSGELGFRQTLDFGNRNMYRSMTVIDLPQWNSLSAKMTFVKSGIDGFVKNAGPSHDFGENNQIGGKLQLRWEPVENFQADYFYEHVRQEATSQQYWQNAAWNNQTITLYDPVTFAPVESNLYDQADQRRGTTYRAIDLPLSETRVKAHGLTLSWDVNDALTLKSLTGYRESRAQNKNDFAEAFAGLGGPTNVIEDFVTTSREFSQELQFLGDMFDQRLSYTAGLYYFKQTAVADQVGETYIILPPATAALFGVPALFFPSHNLIEVEKRSKAVFGQVTWRPEALSQLELTAGGRYTKDNRVNRTLDVLTNTPGAGSGDFSKSTFTASANYHWADDLSTYAKVATGYRAGGICPYPTTTCFAPSFGPETVTTYELGLKSYWLDRRLLLNLAAYYSDYDDLQINVTNGQLGPAGRAGVINAGASTIQGVEVDLQAELIEDVTFTLSYSYLDAVIDEMNLPGTTYDAAVNPASPYGVGGQAKNGFVIPYAPEHSVSAGIDYTFLHPAGGDLTARLDYRFQDSMYSLATYGSVPGQEFGQIPSHGVFNGRLTFAKELSRGGRTSIALWGKNMFDKEYVQSVLALGGDNLTSFTSGGTAWAPPRTYGVSFTYDYK